MFSNERRILSYEFPKPGDGTGGESMVDKHERVQFIDDYKLFIGHIANPKEKCAERKNQW
jgi:hypothetical protein